LCRNGKIVMHIKIKQESSLAEQSSALNLTTMSVFEKIEKAQSEVIRKEIMTAFEKSKELNADIFGFGRMLHKKYKNEWEKLKDRWDEVYPTIELDIEIEAKIQKTDLLVKPAAPGQKEE
jgi:spore germination protein KC